MNAFLEFCNRAGQDLAAFAWPMLLQSSLLIVFLFLMDRLLRRRVRAALRYGLWLLVLVKLLLPPSLVFPTGIVYWLGPTAGGSTEQPAIAQVERPGPFASAFGWSPAADTALSLPAAAEAAPIPEAAPAREASAVAVPLPAARVSLELSGGLFLAWVFGVAGLLLFLFQRWRFVRWFVREARPAPGGVRELADGCARELNLKPGIPVRITGDWISPAVCGFWRPAIVIPEVIFRSFTPVQMRSVLLHEMAHIKRGDAWVNLFQTLLQVVYFYHPLLWAANAAIRRTREQAVDEMVCLAMREEAGEYPETLLEVARISFSRPMAALGLIGILESKSRLRERIQRLLTFPIPKMAAIGKEGYFWIFLTGAVAMPMGYSKTQGAEGFTPSGPAEVVEIAFAKNGVSAFAPVSTLDLLRKVDQVQYRSKRSQAGIYHELLQREDAVAVLIEVLQNGQGKGPESLALRRKAAALLGDFGVRAKTALPALLAVLEEDEELSRLAVRSLGQMGPAALEAVPLLIEELRFQNGEAAQALVRINPDSPEVFAALTEMLFDLSKSFPSGGKRFIVEAVAAMNLPLAELKPVLDRAVTEGDPSVMEPAARALHRLFGETHEAILATGMPPHFGRPVEFPQMEFPEILEKLDHPATQAQALQALLRLPVDSWGGPEVLPKLLEIARNANSRWVGNAFIAIGRLGPEAREAVPLLIEHLQGDEIGIVNNALSALGNIGPDAAPALPEVLKFLDDPIPQLQRQAANALRKIDRAYEEKVLPVFMEQLNSPSEGAFFLFSILGEMGPAAREAIPRLKAIASNPGHQERWKAAETIWKVDPAETPWVVPVLIQAMEDKTLLNRHVPAFVLGEMGAGAESALPALLVAAQEPHELLQKNASEAVQKIRGALK